MLYTPDKNSKSTQQVSWEQRLLKNVGRQKTNVTPEYQELKFTLHRKLVDKINLEALASIDNQRVRAEVREALIHLIDAEATLLSSLEKQQIADEVLDEVFGLGPLEPLLTRWAVESMNQRPWWMPASATDRASMPSSHRSL
jgi:pilus assembly protein CpaF